MVMNLDSRPDRLEQVTQELSSQGIVFERFPAIKDQIGWKGYNKTIKAVFETYWDIENLFLFEDDCYFESDLQLNLLDNLPNDWDGIWLGSNLQSDHHNKVSESLYRLENGWNTHAVLLRKQFRDWCLEHWDESLVFDEWIRLNALPKRNCYVVSPMIAFQRPSNSDIVGGYADYSEAWQKAKSRLK